MNRTRSTRNAQAKPFVSGGVLNNFTGTTPQANIQIPTEDPTPVLQQRLIAAQQNNNLKEIATVNDLDVPIGNNTEATNADGTPKKRWIRPPINKKIKRLRQNRRLRKMLTPKNALMSLNELMGAAISDYTITPEERGFVAQVFVNNVQYEGRGPSKISAKNNASEKALRDIIIQKMVQTPKAAIKGNLPVTLGEGTFNFATLGETEDVEMKNDENNDEKDENLVEVPMLHLASFALHKLFSEWQAEGFEIPDFKSTSQIQGQGDAQAENVVQPAVPIKTEVPENAQSMHPSSLLCMMRPGTKYVDLGSEGKSPAIIHRIGVEVDGKQFFGVAKNKKQARKAAAREACNALFGTHYPAEDNVN